MRVAMTVDEVIRYYELTQKMANRHDEWLNATPENRAFVDDCAPIDKMAILIDEIKRLRVLHTPPDSAADELKGAVE